MLWTDRRTHTPTNIQIDISDIKYRESLTMPKL